jgi:hypothetical protein
LKFFCRLRKLFIWGKDIDYKAQIDDKLKRQVNFKEGVQDILGSE